MTSGHDECGLNERTCAHASGVQHATRSAFGALRTTQLIQLDGGPRSGWRRYRGDTRKISFRVACGITCAIAVGGVTASGATGSDTPLANITTAHASSLTACWCESSCNRLCAVGHAAKIVSASTNPAQPAAMKRRIMLGGARSSWMADMPTGTFAIMRQASSGRVVMPADAGGV